MKANELKVKQINTPLHTPLVTLLMHNLQAHAQAWHAASKRHSTAKLLVALKNCAMFWHCLMHRPSCCVLFLMMFGVARGFVG
jgi:hypothetical protein